MGDRRATRRLSRSLTVLAGLALASGLLVAIGGARRALIQAVSIREITCQLRLNPEQLPPEYGECPPESMVVLEELRGKPLFFFDATTELQTRLATQAFVVLGTVKSLPNHLEVQLAPEAIAYQLLLPDGSLTPVTVNGKSLGSEVATESAATRLTVEQKGPDLQLASAHPLIMTLLEVVRRQQVAVTRLEWFSPHQVVLSAESNRYVIDATQPERAVATVMALQHQPELRAIGQPILQIDTRFKHPVVQLASESAAPVTSAVSSPVASSGASPAVTVSPAGTFP